MTNSNYQTPSKQWSERWFAMLNEFGLCSPAGRDKQMNRGSRITRLEVLVGAISAEVQDRVQGVCTVLIQVTPWDEATWARVLDTLGSQPFFVTQALAGNLPAELEQTLQQLDAPLLPAQASELQQRCSCKNNNGKALCPELLAVHQQFSQMLNEEPWLLLRLRGRDRQQILQTLQARRSASNSSALANAKLQTPTPHREPESYVHRSGNEAAATTETVALTEQIAHFWGSRRQLENFHHHIMSPSIELVLLRRLGAPTPSAEGGVAYEQLSRIYRKVTAEALTLAYAPEANDETVD
ncbi:MAG: hypothetical protein U0350_16685 [Caldilineaceae bacterium]